MLEQSPFLGGGLLFGSKKLLKLSGALRLLNKISSKRKCKRLLSLVQETDSPYTYANIKNFVIISPISTK